MFKNSKIKISGEKPNKETIFTSCDSLYFDKFFLGFSKSILNLRSKNLHIHLINPDEKNFIEINKMKEQFQKLSNFSLTYSFENTLLENNDLYKKIYYASSRFFHQEFFKISKCLLVDIDSVFLKNFEFPKENIGIVFEPERAISMQVKAGFFYFTKDTIDFLRYNNKILLELTWRSLWWGVDQFSLFITYEKFKNDYSFYYFDKNYFSKNIVDKPIFFPRGLNKNQLDFDKMLNLFKN